MIVCKSSKGGAMPETYEKFAAARRASNLTVENAAAICGISVPTYIDRERNPLMFRLHEVKSLYGGMTDTAKKIMRDAMGDIFLP